MYGHRFGAKPSSGNATVYIVGLYFIPGAIQIILEVIWTVTNFTYPEVMSFKTYYIGYWSGTLVSKKKEILTYFLHV